MRSYICALPVPAISQLNYGALLREYAPAVHIRAVAHQLSGLRHVGATASGLVNGRRLRFLFAVDFVRRPRIWLRHIPEVSGKLSVPLKVIRVVELVRHPCVGTGVQVATFPIQHKAKASDSTGIRRFFTFINLRQRFVPLPSPSSPLPLAFCGWRRCRGRSSG